MPPQPQNPAQTIHQPTEVHAAWLTALAVLIAALLGAAGGITGAVIASDNQITATQQQSQRDFLRTQRQGIYAEFLLQQQSLDAEERELAFNVANRGIDALDKQYRDPNSDFNKMKRSVATIRLVGSAKTAQQANALLHLHTEIITLIDIWRSQVRMIDDPTTTPSNRQALVSLHDKDDNRLVDMMNEQNGALLQSFVNQARTEIGSE